MERGENRPSESGKPRPLTPQEECDVIDAKLDEMFATGEKLPPDFFLLTLKARVLSKRRYNLAGPAEDMRSHLGRISNEAEHDRNEEAQTAITKIHWAFLTIAAQHNREIITDLDIQEYNKLQREYSEKGQVARGVELSPELTQHLAWMLDRVQIPYDVGEEAICIPFAPLEQTMRLVAPAWEDTWRPDPFYPDHEKRAPVNGLMEEWKQNQGNQEG